MSERGPGPWAHLALGLLILLLFGTGLRAPLIYDDAAFILKNPLVTGPWPGFGAFFSTSFSSQGEYEPLGTLLHWVLYQTAGEEAFLYRLSSLLLHWASASLFLALFGRLLGNARAAWAAAALFALYPGHTEVLAVSTFKKHLLVSVGAAGVLLLQTARPRKPFHAWAAAGCLLLALFAKESALAIPLLAAGASWAGGPGPRGRLKEDLPFLGMLAGVSVAFCLGRTVVIPRTFGSPLLGSWPLHVLTSAKLFGWSLAQLPYPWDLCLEHSLGPVRWSGEGLPFLYALGLAAGGLLWCARKDRLLAYGQFWTAAALLPFMNLLPYLNYSLVANRYLYLASAGFFLTLARAGQLLTQAQPRARPAVLGAAAALGLFYAAADARRMVLFTDLLELGASTAACAPGNPRAHSNLASVCLGLRLHDRAEQAALRAVALAPGDGTSLQALAWVYARTGRLAQAVALLEGPARRTGDPGMLETLAALHLQAKRPEPALRALQDARRGGPVSETNRLNTGIALGLAGNIEEAERELLPLAAGGRLQDQAFKALGDAYRKAGRLDEAASAYRMSLEISPMQSDTVLSLARLEAGRGRRADAALILDRFAALLEKNLSPMKQRASAREGPLLLEAEGILAEIRRQRALL